MFWVKKYIFLFMQQILFMKLWYSECDWYCLNKFSQIVQLQEILHISYKYSFKIFYRYTSRFCRSLLNVVQHTWNLTRFLCKLKETEITKYSVFYFMIYLFRTSGCVMLNYVHHNLTVFISKYVSILICIYWDNESRFITLVSFLWMSNISQYFLKEL